MLRFGLFFRSVKFYLFYHKNKVIGRTITRALTNQNIKKQTRTKNSSINKKMSVPSDTILIYMTTITSTTAILKKQRAIVDILEAKKIPHAQIDMCSNTKARPHMLSLIPENIRKEKLNNGPILPPQIFCGESYCGDYEDFVEAKEIGLLFSFFKRWPEEGSEEMKILEHYKNSGVRPPFCADDF